MGAGKAGGTRGPSGSRVGEEVSRKLEAGRGSPAERPVIILREEAVARATAYLESRPNVAKIGHRPIHRHIAVAASGTYTAKRGEVATHHAMLSRILFAGYRLRPSPLETSELGEVKVSRRDRLAFIRNEGETPLWLWVGGDTGPQAVTARPVPLTEGMLVVQGDYNQAMKALGAENGALSGQRAFRAEKVNGALRLFPFEPAGQEVFGSWTPRQFLARSLGHSPAYNVERHYAGALDALNVFAATHRLQEAEVKQVLSQIVEAALWSSTGERDALTSKVRYFLELFLREAEFLEDETWSPTEIRNYILACIKEKWQPKEGTSADWVFIPPLAPHLIVLMNMGFSWEEGVALVMDLVKLDPGSVSSRDTGPILKGAELFSALENIGDVLSRSQDPFIDAILFQLEDVAEKVRLEKGLGSPETPDLGLGFQPQGLMRDLGLSPRRLRDILVATVKRGGTEISGETEHPLAHAFRVSIIDMHRSTSATLDVIDSFFRDTFLPLDALPAYVALPREVSLQFVQGLSIFRPIISLLPRGVEGTMAGLFAYALLVNYEVGQGSTSLRALVEILPDSHP